MQLSLHSVLKNCSYTDMIFAMLDRHVHVRAGFPIRRARLRLRPTHFCMHVTAAACVCTPPPYKYSIVNLVVQFSQAKLTQARMETPQVVATPNVVSSIFGSPPEPIFNESTHGVGPELLQSSLKSLAARNDAAIHTSEVDSTEGCFKSGTPVRFVFELSRHFGLRPEVQYRAAELFHQFMLKHIIELYQHVQDSRGTDSPIQWSDVENRLKHQIVLRVVSCVQLASKLSSHYSIVSLSRARHFLTSCGYRYATASLVQSEVRVLKTLDFKVHHPTPVEFLEVLLEALGHNDGSIQVKQMHGVSLRILDVFYLSRCKVFAKLRKSIEQCKGQAPSPTVIEADFMLLATAVIAASAFMLDQSKSDYIIGHLSRVTCIVGEDILSFASVLLEEVLSDEE